MSKVFVTADTHFGHKNIISYCNRPFNSVQEMDDAIVEKWNSKVGINDTVFHLGDMLWGRDDNVKEAIDLIYSLNGKIYLIPGNHDKLALQCAKTIGRAPDAKLIIMDVLHQYYHQDVNATRGKRLIVMCHYAMRVWDQSHRGAYHLYGHSHGTLPDLSDSLSMDVGVDTNNFDLYSYEDIVEIMGKKNYTPLTKDNSYCSYGETQKYYGTRASS